MVRGILLVISTLTYTVYPKINYIVLLITASLLLLYSNYHRVYKNRLVQFNENFFLFLLILIGTTGILEESKTRQLIVYTIVGVGLLVFCGVIIGGRLIRCCYKMRKIEREFIPNEGRKMQQSLKISDNTRFRDSIFDEAELWAEPLLGDKAIQHVARY